MPEVTVTRTDMAEARERLAAARFLIVDVELPEEAPADGESVARQLGLEADDLDWLGRKDEPARADFLGHKAGFVVPVIHDDQVAYIHALVTEQFLVTVHHGRAGLASNISAQLRHERPPDIVAVLFLLLQEALATFRRAAVQDLLLVEELEDDMFQERRPEQIYRLSMLRRRSALLHHSLLPYLQVVDEVFTRRMLNPSFPEERQRLAQEFSHAARLVLANIESLQDASRRAFASYSSLAAGEQNGVINRLAIVSTIFLPLTFLSGFFGMNFTYLTDELESKVVFWLLAVGLQVAVLFVAFYVLHRTRIWRRLRDED
ncbi:magnesium transporter CorA family protein [Streptomyces sp. NBC_01445]|uniref:magnesium transporter CorA family protein n=1 Tax=Streptomyces sp. NBC_01445 TaxID=2903869 RepID=UPI002DD85FCB|nr:CorA family divalent cation transporter [Streptomyces sp. NBC_01445]WSE11639.1 CorA family divalent cation transporter [Streptomyces sp. NBC_01445]